MKEEIKGQRFSKLKTVTGNIDEVTRHLLELYKQGPDGKTRIGISFAERINNLRRAAEETLKTRRLPHTPGVWKKGETWSMDKPHKFTGGSRLDYHIIKRLGYAHDSPEGLSARIISLVDETERSLGEKRDMAFFELGNLYRLFWVYGIISSDASQGGKKGGGKNRKLKNDEVKSEYQKLTTVPKHNRAAILAKRMGVNANTIRAHLRKK